MSFTCLHSRTLSKILMVTLLAAFLSTACSVRQYRMKRAERLYKQGHIYIAKGELERAVEKFEESLSLSKMMDHRAGIADNMNAIGLVHMNRYEYAKARDIFMETLPLYRKLELNPEISKTLSNIASTFLGERRFNKAISQYEELLNWDAETGNRLGQAITLNNMGLIYQNHLRDTDKAREKYEEALRIFEELGNEEYANSVRKSLATLRQ